jgi:oligosaccharide repeat unit polymerase
MELVIYLLFFALFFYLNYQKHQFNGGTFIIFLYGIGVICAMFLLIFTDLYAIERLNIIAILYHCLCLYLFLGPIVYVANRIGGNFKMPSLNGLKIYNFIIIFFSIGTYIANTSKVIEILKMDDLSLARNMYNYGVLYEDQSSSFIDYLGAYGSAMSYFALFLFFYYLVNKPEKKRLILTMLLASFTDAITSLTMVGRGGLIRWGLMFLFFYFIFKKDIDPILIKKIKRYLVVLSSPFIIIFLLITFSRFSGREYPIYIYIIDYIGQSYLYFSYIFNDFFFSTFGGRMNFPVFFDGEGVSRVLSDEVLVDYNLNTFATFIGSFYKDVGFAGTLIIAFIFWLFFQILFKYNTKRNSFFKANVMIIFSQMIINGIFYFQYTSTTKMKVFMAMLCLALFVQLSIPKKKKAEFEQTF